MATIIKEFMIHAAPDKVWEVLRDFGGLQRLVPGFVTACQLDGDMRAVTFANGMQAREQLIGVDEAAQRLSYTVVGGRASYYHASAQVFKQDEAQTRFVWTIDLLPHELAGPVGAMMAQGAAAMQKGLGQA